MSTISAFRALRPRPSDAERIASVPYDVVSTEEARALAEDNPLSFLRVSRPEIELPDTTDPHADVVYERAAQNFETLKARSLVVEDEAAVYLYRLAMGGHVQIGVAGCFALDEYDRGVIKKHERTRPDKEDDRTRHMLTLRAQTGPVFLTYRAASNQDALRRTAERIVVEAPLFDFTAPDQVRHTLWRVTGPDRDAIVSAFARVPALYIADGHHRAASAARARQALRKQDHPTNDGAETFLAVAFPDDQVQILPYNRIVKDLGGLSTAQFLEAVGQRFTARRGPESPAVRGDIAMFFQGGWRTLRSKTPPDPSNAIQSLDVSLLQDQLLAPILNVHDVRTDKRIEFIGGARGIASLERAVNSGQAAVAFSLFPVSVSDLMAVSDAGEIMPPKSTWFEPKLRDGLLIHEI